MRRVFVLGNATVDIVQQVERFPHPGETVLTRASFRCAGGKGLNQALAAARTGVPVVLVAPVGDDADAGFLAQSIAAEQGLTVDWLPCSSATDLSVIWISNSGENVIVSSADSALSLQPEQARALCKGLQEDDLLVVQGNLSGETTLAAVEMARARGAQTILNTAPIAWDMSGLLRKVDLVIANEGEARALSGQARDPARALQDLGVATVIVTLGARGARVVQKEGDTLIPAPVVTAVDTAGAGDVFVGTLAGCLALDVSLMAAVTVAVSAASHSVMSRGTTPSFPSRETVRHLLDLMPQVTHA